MQWLESCPLVSTVARMATSAPKGMSGVQERREDLLVSWLSVGTIEGCVRREGVHLARWPPASQAGVDLELPCESAVHGRAEPREDVRILMASAFCVSS